MIPIDQALNLIQQTIQPADRETVSLGDATGRVLAEPVTTDIDSPPHHKSVMDGFAVKASDISNGATLSVVETVTAGEVPTRSIESGMATRIMTGAPIPDGADAVVMIEQTEYDDARQSVQFNLDSLTPGHHVMARASAMRAGDEVLPAGHTVRPQDIGLLAESGAATVTTFTQPSISVLPTGDELVSCDQFPGPGMIRNSNGPMLLSLARAQSNDVTDLGVGRDNREELAEKVSQGLQSDFLILSGGVSAGMLDLVPEILTGQKVEEVFHKVAVKPGKPIWFGVRQQNGRSQYVFGLPGNPVSSLVGFNVFVRAALAARMGQDVHQSSRLRHATLTGDHQVRGNRKTYWPVHANWSADPVTATPVNWRGSSDMRALGHANGLGIFDVSDGGNFTSGSRIQVMSLA